MEFVSGGDGSKYRTALVQANRKAAVFLFEDGERVELPLDALNGYVPVAKTKYQARLSNDKTRVYALHPFSATVICEFEKFAAREGQPPIPQMPFEREGKTRAGGTYTKDWMEFKAIVSIVAPAQFAGLEVAVKLRYYFAPSSLDKSVAAIKGKGKWSVKLGSFLDNAYRQGVSNLRIGWSENVLPALEVILQKEGRPFLMVIGNGWPDSFGEAPSMPKKKAAKKVAPKAKKAKKGDVPF